MLHITEEPAQSYHLEQTRWSMTKRTKGKHRNLITRFQTRNEQQLPVAEQHRCPCSASNWLLCLPTPACLLWLVQKSRRPGPKACCSL